jgi:hypothetical protein
MAGSLDVIKSYLVSLGFSVDQNQYRQFNQLIEQAGKKVESHATGMSANYAKAAGIITGALASVATATAGLLDKISSADLGYQKFALRMYMATNEAKKLKIVTDAMGESLDDIAWIPELRERYLKLMGEAGGMEPGGNFKEQMRYLRDIRTEFTRMKIEATYGLQWVGVNLVKHLAGPLGDADDKLKSFNDWVQENMPRWTDKIAGWIAMMMDLGGSLLRLFKDLGPVLLGIAAYFTVTSPLGRAMLVISTLIVLVDDFYAYIDGRKSSATLAPVWYTLLWITDKIGKSIETMAISLARFKKLYGNGGFWKGVDDPEGDAQFRKDLETIWNRPFSGGPGSGAPAGVGGYGAKIGAAFGSNADIATRIMMAESTGRPGAWNRNKNGSIDYGLFQINQTNIPALKKAGIIGDWKDLLDPDKNIEAAAWLAKDARGWSPWNSSRAKWSAGMGDVKFDVGSITINVPGSNATPDEIARAVQKGVEEGTGMAIARRLREFQGAIQ